MPLYIILQHDKADDWVVLVGLMDGKPYEVIGGKADQVIIPSKFKTGKITKRTFKTVPSKYDLFIGDNDEQMVLKDVVSIFDNANYAGYTRTISFYLYNFTHFRHLSVYSGILKVATINRVNTK